MNVMLVSVRYPWTVIPIGLMGNYMNSLEHACVQQKASGIIYCWLSEFRNNSKTDS